MCVYLELFGRFVVRGFPIYVPGDIDRCASFYKPRMRSTTWLMSRHVGESFSTTEIRSLGDSNRRGGDPTHTKLTN